MTNFIPDNVEYLAEAVIVLEGLHGEILISELLRRA